MDNIFIPLKICIKTNLSGENLPTIQFYQGIPGLGDNISSFNTSGTN